jgi:hypothetical protein
MFVLQPWVTTTRSVPFVLFVFVFLTRVVSHSVRFVCFLVCVYFHSLWFSVAGQVYVGSGTSASTPVMAGTEMFVLYCLCFVFVLFYFCLFCRFDGGSICVCVYVVVFVLCLRLCLDL